VRFIKRRDFVAESTTCTASEKARSEVAEGEYIHLVEIYNDFSNPGPAAERFPKTEIYNSRILCETLPATQIEIRTNKPYIYSKQ